MRHTVTVSIQEFPSGYTLVFFESGSNRGIGPMLHFTSEERVFELLRRARANLETINIVEMTLAQHRPVMVDLHLTPEQFARLAQAPRLDDLRRKPYHHTA